MRGFKAEFSPKNTSDEYVIVEDDGKAAYAYLYIRGKIQSMVWLYNRAATPKDLTKERGSAGPLNSKDFVIEGFSAPKEEKEVEALCRHEGGVLEAGVYIRGKLHALLKEGAMPGWCILASKDGPLALKLDASAVA